MKQSSFYLLLFKDVGLSNHLLGSGQIAIFAGQKIWQRGHPTMTVKIFRTKISLFSHRRY